MLGTISVVSHGHGTLLRALLTDLAAQKDIDAWQVIVTLNIAEDFDESLWLPMRVVVIRNEKAKGFGANHNAASARAVGHLFVMVNPDIRLPDINVLEQIAAVGAGDRTHVLRAPVVVSPAGAVEDSVRGNLSPFNILWRIVSRKREWEASPDGHGFFWLAGMFLIVPLDKFKSIGGFDERFHLYCEDYDLSARWRVGGGTIELIRDVRVVHDAQRDSRRSLRHLRWHVGSLWRVWCSSPFWRVTFGRYPRIRAGKS